MSSAEGEDDQTAAYRRSYDEVLAALGTMRKTG